MFYRKVEIFKLFELIEANFEYNSQTGLQEIKMGGFIKKGLYLIYWWGSVLILATVCLIGGPLYVKNDRFV